MSIQQRIKQKLIELASKDELPLDLNDIDPEVFTECVKSQDFKYVLHHTTKYGTDSYYFRHSEDNLSGYFSLENDPDMVDLPDEVRDWALNTLDIDFSNGNEYVDILKVTAEVKDFTIQ